MTMQQKRLMGDMSISNNVKIRIDQMLFTVGTALLSINFLLYSTNNFVNMQNALRMLSVGLLFAALLLSLQKIRLDFSLIVLAGLSVIASVGYGSDALNFTIILLFCANCSCNELEFCKRMICSIILACLALYLILYAIGLINMGYTNYGGRLRFNLGFTNVNAGAIFFLSLVVLPLHFKKHKLVTLILFLATSFAVYLLTDTRSVLIFCLLFSCLFITFLFFCNKGHEDIVACVVRTLFFIGITASIVMPALSGSDLDVLLSYRPSIYQEALSSLSPLELLFGSGKAVEIDNSYIVFCTTYGLVFCLFLAYLILRSISVLASRKEWNSLALVGAMFLFAAIEGTLFRPELPITLLFWLFMSPFKWESDSWACHDQA